MMEIGRLADVDVRVVPVVDLNDEGVAAYARLTEAQLRNKLEPEKGIFIAESFKVIERALDAGYTPLSMLVTPKWANEVAYTVERYSLQGITVYIGEEDALKGLTGFVLTRGALAAFRRPILRNVEELVKNASSIAVIDGVVDHTNVGAIFRSAAALGVDAVLVTPTTCDPLYRRAVRVSMGTVFQVPWTRICSDASEWLRNGPSYLGKIGFETAACALSSEAIELDDPRLDEIERLALVFGTEGDGLAREVISSCDHIVRIPMMYGVDSLNVAAASAVFFWHLCRPASRRMMGMKH